MMDSTPNVTLNASFPITTTTTTAVPSTFIQLNSREPTTKDAELTPNFDEIIKDTGNEQQQDPEKQLQKILDCVLPPRRIEEGGQFFVQRASPTPTTRLDLIALQEKFEAILANARAKPFGICPIRRRIYDDLFDELIRQVTVSCAERGLLLLRVRDEIRLTLLAYQGVLESAIAYGIRKAVAVERHQTNAIVERDAEKQKNVQLNAKIEQLNKQIATERLVKEEEVKLLERSMRDENERLLESNRTLKMHLQSIIQMDQQNGPQPSEIND
uniref:Axonemal dynein light chain p33 n=1 Tax=Panagrellus redivivus TaxID=6233 RepID=A0A7E4WAP7_PANRE